MRVLYTTDLHGAEYKYDLIYDSIKKLKPDIVINGGDMLPIRPNFMKQGVFIYGFLDAYFYKVNKQKICHLVMPGNDDLSIFDVDFQKVCDKYQYVLNIAQQKVNIGDFDFIGFNLVSDLPFGLKDRCRKDHDNFKLPRQLGKAVYSSKKGFKQIENWFEHINSLPTIEEELRILVKPIDYKKTILTIHDPPTGFGLDVVYNGETVGSKSVYNYIFVNQPMLTLHGHIHESPEKSGVWRTNIGSSVCIQPGQTSHVSRSVIVVLIDLAKLKFERIFLDNTKNNSKI